MAGKWLELLKEIAPRVSRVAFLFDPETEAYAEYFLSPFKAAAASFSVEAITTPVRDTSELESAIAAQARVTNSGLIVMPRGVRDGSPPGDRIASGSLSPPGCLPIPFFR